MTAAGATVILFNLSPAAFMSDSGARAGTRDRHDGRPGQRISGPGHLRAPDRHYPIGTTFPHGGGLKGLRSARKLGRIRNRWSPAARGNDGQADETDRGVVFP